MDFDMDASNDFDTELPPISEQSHILILANHAEIQRRISAFIDRQRSYLNALKAKEFPVLHNEDGLGCARCTPNSSGLKHRIKTRRIMNIYGPQSKAKISSGSDKSIEGISERVQGLEKHVHLKSDERKDIFQRIKDLEDRVLYLESLSPEYLNILRNPVQQGASSSRGEELSKAAILKKIEERMQYLEEKMK